MNCNHLPSPAELLDSMKDKRGFFKVLAGTQKQERVRTACREEGEDEGRNKGKKVKSLTLALKKSEKKQNMKLQNFSLEILYVKHAP